MLALLTKNDLNRDLAENWIKVSIFATKKDRQTHVTACAKFIQHIFNRYLDVNHEKIHCFLLVKQHVNFRINMRRAVMR